MLGVAPLTVAGQVGFGALPERDPLLLPARVDHLDLLPTPFVERVDALEQQLAAALGFLAAFGERDQIDRAEPHGPGTAKEHVAEQPALAAVGDLQPQAAAVAVASLGGDRRDLPRCQLVARHLPTTPYTRPCPQMSTGLDQLCIYRAGAGWNRKVRVAALL
jgi:hypothetical protein